MDVVVIVVKYLGLLGFLQGGVFLVLFLEFREDIGELGVQRIIGGYIVEIRYGRYILDRILWGGFGGFERVVRIGVLGNRGAVC